MGPAFAFDHDARNAFSRLIAGGFVHAVLAGNALATHDLEAAYLNTALGQNIYTQESQPNGHYNHLDTINRVRLHGSIPAFLKAEQIENGILHTCERHGVPVRAGGLHPGRRASARRCIGRRRMPPRTPCADEIRSRHHGDLHGHRPAHHRRRQHDPLLSGAARRNRAAGVFLLRGYRTNSWSTNCSDRGSLSARGIVTNVQDFIVHLSKELIQP